MSVMKTVKPLPKEYCKGCLFNGCYPWNMNPAILCSEWGGLILAIKICDDKTGFEECTQYKPVSEEMWDSWLRTLKKDAMDYEELCESARTSDIQTNHLPYGQRRGMK